MISLSNKIYFVSYPKSGRTWVRMVIAYVQSELTNRPITDYLNNSYLDNETYPFAKIIVNHGFNKDNIFQAGDFPAKFYKDKKIMLLIRDPRDILVSHYHFLKDHYGIFTGSIEDFIKFKYPKSIFIVEQFINKFDKNKYLRGFKSIINYLLKYSRKNLLKDKFIYNIEKNEYKNHITRFGLKSIINYMNAWIENKNIFSDFKIFAYEDIKTNQFEEFKKIFEYFEIDCDESLIKEAIEYASFENMQKIELEGSLDWKALNSKSKSEVFTSTNDSNLLKTRKGKIGSHKEELSQKILNYINISINKYLNNEFKRYKT